MRPIVSIHRTVNALHTTAELLKCRLSVMNCFANVSGVH